MPHKKHAICVPCNRDVVAESSSANHVLHLLLALLSMGLWAPVWILISMARTWKCSKCGRRV